MFNIRGFTPDFDVYLLPLVCSAATKSLDTEVAPSVESFTMESFYLWYAEQGCPKINDDYSYSTRSIYDDPVLVCYHQYGICTGTCPFPISHHGLFHPPKSQPNRGVVKDLAKKDPQEAEVTLSSESDSDSYYSDCFDSAPDPTPYIQP
jgi:hypothetical protein